MRFSERTMRALSSLLQRRPGSIPLFCPKSPTSSCGTQRASHKPSIDSSLNFAPTRARPTAMLNCRTYHPGKNPPSKLRVEGMPHLADSNRLAVVGNTLSYVRFADDFGAVRRTNIWTDTGVAGFSERKKQYVVETNPKIIERCVLMTTEPGDLVLDPTCGSGTTAFVAEKWGRRWITVDTSRVALAIARERVLTAKFEYFKLKDAAIGVGAGFEYRTLTRVTASSIGYGHAPEVETLYDQPLVDGSK